MSPWVLPVVSLAVGIAGGWIGAWMGVRVQLAVVSQRLLTAEREIDSLRTSRHEHAKMIQNHEARISTLERRP